MLTFSLFRLAPCFFFPNISAALPWFPVYTSKETYARECAHTPDFNYRHWLPTILDAKIPFCFLPVTASKQLLNQFK